MTLQGLDSAYPPSPDAVASMKAAGIDVYGGYISTAPYDGGSHFGLWHPWPREGFDYVKALGAVPIAYASGWDDPAALKLLAASWGVRLCLDVEGRIRGDGPWVQAWLDASGAGLYGNAGCHTGRRAAFHILAAYPSWAVARPPSATWSGVRPAGPCGWQWRGTHSEFGVSVDRANFDDWFGGDRFSAGAGTLASRNTTRRRATVVATADSIKVFVRGLDNNALFLNRFSGGAWSGWKSLGGILLSGDIQALQVGQRIDVFVVGGGGDGNDVYQLTSLDDGATWGPFHGLGGNAGGPLTVLGPQPQLGVAGQAVDLGPVTAAALAAQAAAEAAAADAKDAKTAAAAAGVGVEALQVLLPGK